MTQILKHTYLSAAVILGMAAIPLSGAADEPEPIQLTVSVQTSGPALARDHVTYADDRLLINRCIENDRTKVECLCVTKVLKYELPLEEYKAAARLYTHSASTRRQQSVERLGLAAQGFSQAEIRDARHTVEGLSDMPDFAERCAEADRYFQPAQSS